MIAAGAPPGKPDCERISARDNAAMSAPAAEFQLNFLAKVERLLATGSFTATYKFALLIALANLAVELGDDSGRPLRLDLDDVAREFTRLYWNSARPYPGVNRVLNHSRTKSNAAILRLLSPHAESHGRAEDAFRRSPKETGRLIERVRREVLCRYPLYHLQLFEARGSRERLFDDFLYPLPSERETARIQLRSIELRPGVAACLRTLHGVIVSMAEAAWARWLRETNTSLGADRWLETYLFGQDRASLVHLAEPLHELQSGRCFYSGRRLAAPRDGEVDHFIPWSLYPCDSPFNLVLANPAVNRSKTDLLPSERHLQELARRNREQAHLLVAPLPHGCGAAADERGSVEAIIRWAYGGTRRVRRYCWDGAEGGRLVEVGRGWESSLR